jgi:ferric-chelate reductase
MDSSGMMNDSMPMPADLTDAGMNMTNYTVAYNFLQDILDYDGFQPIDEAISRAFWYGIVFVIGFAAITNLVQWGTLKARFAPQCVVY